MIQENSDSLHRWREDTPGIEKQIHLNNAGSALPPRQVLNAAVDYLVEEAGRGGYETAAARQSEINGMYEALGRMLNTDPGQIAWMSSATDGYNRALTSIRWQTGDVILTTINDYASNQIAFMQLRERFGVKVIRAEDDLRGGVSVDSMAELIRVHDPKLVAVTHIPTNSGLIQPVKAIGELCENQDILYLVDACQSAGQLPLDVRKIRCDFLSATFRKFMRGPRGGGFLYVSPKVLESGLAPLVLDLHSAVWTEPDGYRMQDDAKRFELWEKPYALMVSAKAAVEYALEVGLSDIELRVRDLAGYARGKLAEIPGLKSLDKGTELGGIVTFTFPNAHFGELKDHLIAGNINLSFAPKFVAVIDLENKGAEWVGRLSPHYYNTREEVDTAVESIRAWAIHSR